MIKEFPRTIETADPSKFSIREETLDLQLEGGDVYIDKSSKERFHKLSPQRAQDQKLLALMVKGVINVSDVVKVGRNYYSHMQNFENIAPSKDDVKAEVQADIFILGDVFRDFDHGYLENHPNSPAWKGSGSSYKHFNLYIDETNNKLNFFDFNEPWLHSLIHDKIQKSPAALKASFLEGIHLKFGLMPDPNSTVMNILKKKVKILIHFYSDGEFERFSKMIERSRIEMEDDKQRSLFNHIQIRLRVLDDVLLNLEH